jgi:hypothetical protein
MPIRKARLSKAEQAKYFARLAQLLRAGCDVRIPDEWSEDSRALDIQIAPPHENIIRQLPNGTVAYAILVRLVALLANLILEDFGLAAAWDPDLIPLSLGKKDLYPFARDFDFTREEVLNHRIEKLLRFHHRGYLAEGWLLATGLKPIPDTYRNNTSVPVEVRFTDQFGSDHFGKADAFVERSARQKTPALRPVKVSGLFEPLVPGMRDAIEESGIITCQAEHKVPAGGARRSSAWRVSPGRESVGLPFLVKP